jgi:hypothetical protein
VLHDSLVELESPFSASPGRLLMRGHARAGEERHSELDPTLLHEIQQTLPDTKTRPADEGLGRPPPWAKFSGHSTSLGAILVAPQVGLNRTTQIVRWGFALRTALFHQRLQHRPLCVRQHGSSSDQDEQDTLRRNEFKH